MWAAPLGSIAMAGEPPLPIVNGASARAGADSTTSARSIPATERASIPTDPMHCTGSTLALVLHDQLAWYVAGPVLGLCVVACRALFNGRLGVPGGFSEVIEKTSRRSARYDWRGWFAIGVLLGGTLYLILAGGKLFEGYGWMTDVFHGTARLVMVPLLLGAGLLIGFGAKTAGGCTSGNGLSGTSMLSRASLVSTATFFATAIVVSFVIKGLT